MPAIREAHNARSQGVPIDDEYEAVITITYVLDSATGQYVPQQVPEGTTPASEIETVFETNATTGNLEYKGTSVQGTAYSTAEWKIEKFEWDADGNLLRKQTKFASRWDSRRNLAWRTDDSQVHV